MSTPKPARRWGTPERVAGVREEPVKSRRREPGCEEPGREAGVTFEGHRLVLERRAGREKPVRAGMLVVSVVGSLVVSAAENRVVSEVENPVVSVARWGQGEPRALGRVRVEELGGADEAHA